MSFPKNLPQFVKKPKAGKTPKQFLKPPARQTGVKKDGVGPSNNAILKMIGTAGGASKKVPPFGGGSFGGM